MTTSTPLYSSSPSSPPYAPYSNPSEDEEKAKASASAMTTFSTPSPPDRLGLTPQSRVLYTSGTAFILGCGLGFAKGGTTAALRYRAENSHRLPTETKGWYFYHRSKNYVVMKESLLEGFRMGASIAPWVGVFFLVEHAIDEVRDDVVEWDWEKGREVQPGRHKDFLGTTVAGLAVAGAFSAVKTLPFQTAARMCKIGLVAGLGFGLTQDALKLARGGRLAYVDLIKRSVGFS